jgi:hypothetical protein
MDLAAHIYTHVARNAADEFVDQADPSEGGGGGASGWSANAGVGRLMSAIQGRPSSAAAAAFSSSAAASSAAAASRGVQRGGDTGATRGGRSNGGNTGAMALVAVSRLSTVSRVSTSSLSTQPSQPDHTTRQLRRGRALTQLMDDSLQYAPLINTLAGSELNQLASAGFTLHVFAPGVPVIAAGAEEECMYVIVQGSMEVVRRREKASLADGGNLDGGGGSGGSGGGSGGGGSGGSGGGSSGGRGGGSSGGGGGFGDGGALADRIAKAGRSVSFGVTAGGGGPSVNHNAAADAAGDGTVVVATLEQGDVAGLYKLNPVDPPIA